MKTFIIICALASLCLSTKAQKNKKKLPTQQVQRYSYLQAVTDIIKSEALTYMAVGIGQNIKKISKTQEILYLNDSISKITNVDGAKIIKKDIGLINEYLRGIIQFGETDSEFLKWNETSVKIGLYNNSLTFVQSHIFSDIELNSFKLDVDARVDHIIKNIILPSLSYFTPLTKDQDLKYFVLNIGFRTRDFTEDTPYLGNGETVAILISRDNLLKYSNAEMSEKEVLKNAIFYNYNANTSNLRKITY